MASSVLYAWVMYLSLQFTAIAASESHSVIWRYGSLTDILPTYKNPIQLDCVGCSDMTWSSTTCQFSTVDNTSMAVWCSRPGIHQITVQGMSENTTQMSVLNVPLSSSPHCHVWGVETEHFTSNGSRQVAVSVWVEQGQSSHSEREALTYQFYSLGESPQLVSLTPSVEVNVVTLGFDRGSSVWEFVVEEVESLPTEVMVEVAGSGVLAVDCGISPLQFIIITREVNNSMLTSHTETSTPDSPLKLIHDHLALGIAILLNGANSYITHDDLATLQQFQVDGVTGEIGDVAFTSTTLCLILAGEIHVLPYNSSEIISPSVTLLAGDRHLAGRSMHIAGETYNIVILWSKNNDVILVSENGGLNFITLSLPYTPDTIHSVNIHPFKRTVSILTTSSSSLGQFIMYDLSNQSWNEDTFSFAYSGGNLTAVYGADGFGDVFIWEETALYYSPNGGETVNTLEVYVHSEATGAMEVFEWSNEHYIKQTVSGKGGQFAVLSSSNRLFYGTIASGLAIEISSGELPGSEAVLSFNSLGQLRIITLSNGIGVTVRTLPVYSLLMDSLYPPPACPFSQWMHVHQQSVFYLDKRESVTLWASVIPAQWKGNEISFAVSDPENIQITSDSIEEETAVTGVVFRNLSINIKPSSSLISIARTAVKFSAANQNLACPNTAQLVSMICMECPPGRHIRVKDIPGKCSSSYEDYTYTIPREYYDGTFSSGRSNSDKRVDYDMELYGCPIVIPYTQDFRPTLELYDDDVLLEEVDADFVVWEVHGRHDYSYTATAKTAGCLRTPQTWNEMLQLDNSRQLSPSNEWTSETYRSCYEEGGELNGRTEYQILNSTGVSSLQWPQRNGMYMFAVTVVARDYSFCHLTAHFAVKVYGASGAAVLGYILLVLTCIIGMGVLIFSYYVYKQKRPAQVK